MQALQQAHNGGYAHYSVAGHGGCGAAHADAHSDDAAMAAKTLFTLAKSEDDSAEAAHGAQPMFVVNGVPAATTGVPMTLPHIAAHAADVQGDAAAPTAKRRRGGASRTFGSASGDAGAASDFGDGGESDGGDGADSEPDIVDGVPVDALGAAPPVFMSWASDGHGNVQPVQLVMTPHGLMPVMHAGQQQQQQFCVPVHGAAAVMHGGPPAVGSPVAFTAAGTPVDTAEDGSAELGDDDEDKAREGSPVAVGAPVAGTVAGVPAAVQPKQERCAGLRLWNEVVMHVEPSERQRALGDAQTSLHTSLPGILCC